MDSTKKEDAPRMPVLGRRDLMKAGVGAVATALSAAHVEAQRQTRPSAPGNAAAAQPSEAGATMTRAGYVHDANRAGGNGPMDDTTRAIVSWVHSYSETKLTEPLVRTVNKTMLDSIGALISGFEEPSVRIAARLAADVPLADRAPLKSTVMGYGLTTTPELATFANSCMIRHTDYNDHGPGGHNSDLIPAALAIGEALHSTGPQVMTAIVIGYELKAAPAGGEPVAAAMAAGKLMGLNEDQLANALTLALTPHVALNKGVGALSMWKGCRSAEAMKCGVWGALMARAGMTGPPQPFEGRAALWSRNGRADVKLPLYPKMNIERMGFKRFPTEASMQAPLELIPEMRAWTKPDEIESVRIQVGFGPWEEVGDAPKWDPRNRETADHSFVYVIARALIDGSIYLDSFTQAKYMDPAARALMGRMTIQAVRGWEGNGPTRFVIRKKTGEERTFDALGGRRVMMIDAPGGPQTAFNTMMTDEETTSKFNRACAYMHVADEQRDRARAVWGNLRAVKDIGEAIRTLAKFGNPRPLQTT
jgi:2-methylcitrate dehydratase